jgi:DNA ligase-associated metallophosphoesterase
VRRACEILVNGVELLVDLSGALYWPARRTLAVADLHLEKGSALAARGQLLPPYDSAATLEALAEVIARYEPARVVSLGDSFHDDGAAGRLAPADARALSGLSDTREWIWIAGNHDPAPPSGWGGTVESRFTLGGLTFCHRARGGAVSGEVSGHYHPRASVRTRAKRISARCFVSDGRRLVLPAFGAYTGGLDVFDPAIAALFPRGFSVHLLGRAAVYGFAGSALSAG